jgi:hypothetical protein
VREEEIQVEIQIEEQNSGTNCVDCERYKKLGEVCVIEHGKKFLWEYCKDFEHEVELPEYDELMRTVKQDMASERKRMREKKKKEIAIRKKEREQRKSEKLRLKRSKIAKKIWEERRKKEKVGKTIAQKAPDLRTKKSVERTDKSVQPKIPKTASSAKATV